MTLQDLLNGSTEKTFKIYVSEKYTRADDPILARAGDMLDEYSMIFNYMPGRADALDPIHGLLNFRVAKYEDINENLAELKITNWRKKTC